MKTLIVSLHRFFFLRYTSTDLKKILELILISNLIYANLISNLGQSIVLLVSSFKFLVTQLVLISFLVILGVPLLYHYCMYCLFIYYLFIY